MMDALDKEILNLIQSKFPVVEEPFTTIAERVGTSEQNAINRTGKLKEEGIIRRIGAVFDPAVLGFSSTLCAARVPEEKLKTFVETVNACAGVTHNYRRNNEYNIWFTYTARNDEEIRRAIAEIKEKTKVTDILCMRAARTFKIAVNFSL